MNYFFGERKQSDDYSPSPQILLKKLTVGMQIKKTKCLACETGQQYIFKAKQFPVGFQLYEFVPHDRCTVAIKVDKANK